MIIMIMIIIQMIMIINLQLKHSKKCKINTKDIAEIFYKKILE